VYDNFTSVIMTSATLTVNKKFNFFADRCGTSLINEEKINYALFNSSFDYERQVKFFVPRGISYSEDTQKHFEKSIEFLKNAILASRGGSLILCSSHKQVENIYNKLLKPLAENNIWLLRQSKGISVGSVVRDFKRDVNSVLIGTETLWQGVDIPGNSLRSLFIYKIPYRLPSLPIVRARMRELDKKGKKSFSLYYEPLAALALKQGFGRLIRKSTDIGVAVLLDENLLNKPQLVNSFPEGVHPKREDPEEIYKYLENFLKKQSVEEPVENYEKINANNSQKEKTYSVEAVRKNFKNAYSPWTKEDDDRLGLLYIEGKKAEEISEIFGRNLGAINSRIKKLGLEI